MSPSTNSDSSKIELIRSELVQELLEALDHARNLEDLYVSLKAQNHITAALLILLDDRTRA